MRRSFVKHLSALSPKMIHYLKIKKARYIFDIFGCDHDKHYCRIQIAIICFCENVLVSFVQTFERIFLILFDPFPFSPRILIFLLSIRGDNSFGNNNFLHNSGGHASNNRLHTTYR